MRFCGVDLRSVHPALSIEKEYPPGLPGRDVYTIAGRDGETVVGYAVTQDEYKVAVNIAARRREDGWRIRAMLAAWAAASGQDTGELEPTHWPGVAYDAIVKSISAPEFVFGFAKVEVIFLLPRAYAHDLAYTTAAGQGRATLAIGGSAACRPTVAQTLAAARDGVTWALDGREALHVNGAFSAGQKLAVDFITGAVTLDGVHVESRLDVDRSSFSPGFTPGMHALTSDDGGSLTARWRCEWL